MPAWDKPDGIFATAKTYLNYTSLEAQLDVKQSECRCGPNSYQSLSLNREILMMVPGGPAAVMGRGWISCVQHYLLFHSTVSHVKITLIAFGSRFQAFLICKS